MPALEGIFYLPDLSLILSRTEKLTFAREHLNEMFGKKYPKYFRAEHVRYYREQSPDEISTYQIILVELLEIRKE